MTGCICAINDPVRCGEEAVPIPSSINLEATVLSMGKLINGYRKPEVLGVKVLHIGPVICQNVCQYSETLVYFEDLILFNNGL